MFLTRVLPSNGFMLSRLAERANGGDAYAQHQLLWQLFPAQSDRQFLFRYEQGRNGPCYYLLSQTEPESGFHGIQMLSKRFRPRLKVGEQLAYTLRANPTRMLKSGTPGQRGQRVDVLMHAKLQAQARGDTGNDIAQLQLQAAQTWLMEPERQARLGVEFPIEPEVTEHQQHQVFKSRGKGGRSKPIQFTSVNYQGILTVIDPDLFV